MTKTNLGDDIFTIVFQEAWWKTIGNKINHKESISIFNKQSVFKFINWIVRYLLGVYVNYEAIVLTNAQPVDGGYLYYIRLTNKSYYILWKKIKQIKV